jgi:hypothetical protein
VTVSPPAVIVVAVIAVIAVTSCGGSLTTSASGPMARFNACIGNTAAGQLSASGQPVVNGAIEPIVDQLPGVVGNVWGYGSHAEAEANAKVMNGYPDRVVRGAYIVEANPNAGADDSLAIQTCAPDIRARGRTQTTTVATAPSAGLPTASTAETTTTAASTGTRATCRVGEYPLKVPASTLPRADVDGGCFKPPLSSTEGVDPANNTTQAPAPAGCPRGEYVNKTQFGPPCFKPPPGAVTTATR